MVVIAENVKENDNNKSNDNASPIAEQESQLFAVKEKLESITDFQEAANSVAKEMEKITKEHKALQKRIRNLFYCQ